MKRIEISKSRTIHTPWLRSTEAASYCGISRTTFDLLARAHELPHGLAGNVRMYHIQVLDQWLATGPLPRTGTPEPADMPGEGCHHQGKEETGEEDDGAKP